MTVKYRNALAEVDEILKLMPAEMLNKIPNSFRDFIKSNKSKNLNVNLSSDVPLIKQNLLKETRIILSLIYRSYLCDKEQKRKLEMEDIKELNEKYSYKNLFKK